MNGIMFNGETFSMMYDVRLTLRSRVGVMRVAMRVEFKVRVDVRGVVGGHHHGAQFRPIQTALLRRGRGGLMMVVVMVVLMLLLCHKAQMGWFGRIADVK